MTPRQAEILAAIEAMTTERGYPPTIRELGERVGIRSTNGISCLLKRLRRDGHLTWEPGSPRTVVVKRPP